MDEFKVFIRSYSKISGLDYKNVLFLIKCHRDKDKKPRPEDWQTKYSRVMTCWKLWQSARSAL